jgi:hypothetical protein
MTPINSINSFSTSRVSLKKGLVSTIPEIVQSVDTRDVDQEQINLSNAILINQLPHGLVNDFSDIIRRINIQALQSLELEQTLNNRQSLQENIIQEEYRLRAIFEELSQDDLRLFIAVFQNQPPIGSDNSNNFQDFFNTNFFFNGLSEKFLENLFHFDVTSQTGSLSALDITGNILDILSRSDFGSKRLESLLEVQTNSGFTSIQIDTSEQSQDDITVQSGSDTVQNLFFYPTPLNPNPPTIIDLFE